MHGEVSNDHNSTLVIFVMEPYLNLSVKLRNLLVDGLNFGSCIISLCRQAGLRAPEPVSMQMSRPEAKESPSCRQVRLRFFVQQPASFLSVYH